MAAAVKYLDTGAMIQVAGLIRVGFGLYLYEPICTYIHIYIYIYPWMTSSNIILVLDTSKNLSPRLSMWPGWQSSGTLQLEAREFGASSGIPQRTNPAGKLCASISFQAVRSGIQTIPRFIWSGCLIQRFVQQRCKYGTVPRLRVTTINIFYEIRKKYYRNWSQCPRNPYLWGMLMMFVEIYLFGMVRNPEQYSRFSEKFRWIWFRSTQKDQNVWISGIREKAVKNPWKPREKAVKNPWKLGFSNLQKTMIFHPCFTRARYEICIIVCIYKVFSRPFRGISTVLIDCHDVRKYCLVYEATFWLPAQLQNPSCLRWWETT